MASQKTEVDAYDLYVAAIEYISDLFTGTPHERFTRDEVLMILNLVRDDPIVMAVLKKRLTKL